MDQAALEAKREYQREYARKWRARPENKQKIKEYKNRYWQKKAYEEFKEMQKAEKESK